MTSLSTPTRVNYGNLEIDTKPNLDAISTALAYGLHTPPQSAGDSRRPSFHTGLPSNASYFATPPGIYASQSSTPAHCVHRKHDSLMQTGLPAIVMGDNPSSEHDSRYGFHHQSLYVTNTGQSVIPDAQRSQETHPDGFGLQFAPIFSSSETRARSGQHSAAFATQAPCLGPALFPPTNEMTPGSSPPESSYHYTGPFARLNSNLDDSTLTNISESGISQHALSHHPQVVVPAQLSPDDAYYQSSFGDCADAGYHNDSVFGSIGSSGLPFGSYDLMTPPSPIDAYFDRSEDEDFLMVKAEETASFPHNLKEYRSGSKKRSSKRRRDADRQPWHRHQTDGGIEVQCEGRPFCLDGPIQIQSPSSQKPHVCLHVEDGKECGRRFDRSEHLKRHTWMHTDIKPYPCPLEGCDKKMQRPDNACDHFKTHLRPKKSGKRNHHVEWEELSQGIWEKYPDKKKAKKLLEKLRIWYKAGMPETASQRRAEAGL